MRLIRTLHRYFIHQAMPAWAVSYYERLIDDVAQIYFHPLVEEILRHAAEGSVIIDAGAGTGQLPVLISRRIANCTIAGLDLSFPCLATGTRIAKSNGARVSFVQADLERCPLKPGSVDLIVSTCSLHHWRQPAKIVGEMIALLKPGGLMLLMDMAADAPRQASKEWVVKVAKRSHSSLLFRIVFPFERNYVSYSRDEACRIFREAGAHMDVLDLDGVFMTARLRPRADQEE